MMRYVINLELLLIKFQLMDTNKKKRDWVSHDVQNDISQAQTLHRPATWTVRISMNRKFHLAYIRPNPQNVLDLETGQWKLAYN